MFAKFDSITVFTGTVIGAGMFGIPYVISKSGLTFGLINLVLVTLILALIYLYLGEISLRTKGTHQLTGLAQHYLGSKGKYLMMISLAFGIYTALAAYMLAQGESLSFLFFGSNQFAFHLTFVFWITMSSLAYFGIKAFEKSEELGIVLISILMIMIIYSSFNDLNINNYTSYSYPNFFTPFGVILFSFLGFSAIPEMKRVLRNQTKFMKKGILIGISIPFVLYLIFTLIVLGLKGSLTPQIATLALGKPFILLGVLTMTTAYLANSNALCDAYHFDLKFSKINSYLLTIIVPFIIFIFMYKFDSTGFTSLISISGVISAGMCAIIVLYILPLAKKHSQRKPEYSIPYNKYLSILISLIFILAVIYEMIEIII